MFPIVSVSYRGTEMKKHHSCPKGSHSPVETEHFKDAMRVTGVIGRERNRACAPAGGTHTAAPP